MEPVRGFLGRVAQQAVKSNPYRGDHLQAELLRWKFRFLWVNGAESANNPAN